jgi:hypothetical protein
MFVFEHLHEPGETVHHGRNRLLNQKVTARLMDQWFEDGPLNHGGRTSACSGFVRLVHGSVDAYKRGFLLCGTTIPSRIGVSGWIDCDEIRPTAGRDTLDGGGVIRWNGIGIGTAVGTPVKAVETGRVALVQRLSTYGLTVILEHGSGYYSVYSQLATATVAAGASVEKGESIGTVGGANTDYGPHLHFEIRGENQIALDPTDWLRRRR